MPKFNVNVTKVAAIPVKVEPSGLNCQAELFLVSNGAKVVTSGLIPFISVGIEQGILLPITMPNSVGIYQVYVDIYAEGILIAAYIGTENVEIIQVIGFTVTLINCPSPAMPGGVSKFNDGTGAWISCGQPGNWPFDANAWRPFPFTIYVYEFVYGVLMGQLGFYSFARTVENGGSYVFDCNTGEFYQY